MQQRYSMRQGRRDVKGGYRTLQDVTGRYGRIRDDRVDFEVQKNGEP